MRYWSNCLTYAFSMWHKHGGYLIIRWSRVLKGVPHFLWAPDGSLDDNKEIRHYTPLKPTDHSKAFWKALRFFGRIKYCEKKECPSNSELCNICKWRNE